MINKVTIKNFMVHSKLENHKIPMVNIIIGKNDSGKTGLLKLLYASVKSLENFSKKSRNTTPSIKKELAEKLTNTFMPTKNELGRLVKKGSSDKLEVDISLQSSNNYKEIISFSFGEKTTTQIPYAKGHVESLPENELNALFIPAKEVLTAFNDIQNIRDQLFGRGFDDTYLDLVRALRVPTTPGRVKLSSVNRDLEELFEGKIEQTKQRDAPFLFKKGNQLFSMSQTAEGIKKIGILTTLINNRLLNKGTVLFLDEPETTLHPDAVRKLVEMLVEMSKNDVQIFMASHSYFVIKQLAICAKRDKINICCWNLERENKNGVTNSFHNLIDGVLPKNSIIDEALQMYEQEISVDLNA